LSEDFVLFSAYDVTVQNEKKYFPSLS